MDVLYFAQVMFDAAQEWMNDVKNDEAMVKNHQSLMSVHDFWIEDENGGRGGLIKPEQ